MLCDNPNPIGIVTQRFIVSNLFPVSDLLPANATGSFGPITSQGNGVYTATFTATQPGKCALGVTLNGSSLASSASPAAIVSEPSAYSFIYLFHGGDSDGAGAIGTLSLSPDGLTLYGTTARGGGPADLGSIFKMPVTGGRPTYLYFFKGGANDGDTPVGTPTLSADGSTLYGMCSGGGLGYGSIFSIPSTGGSPTYLTLFAAFTSVGPPKGSLTLSLEGTQHFTALRGTAG